jgi:iron complex transport system ATP-binding protein
MVELCHVTAGYPEKPVLRDVSLSIQPGQVLAVIGPNGCGKSTLLKTACGLLGHTSGQVLLDGTPLEQYSRKQVAQRVAYLSQERSVPEITARRMVLHGRFPHLSYPRRYGPSDFQIVEEALEAVEGQTLGNQPMSRLSGGQRQRVYIAMTLAQQGQTVLMDEPTTYLDIGHQLAVLELSRRLAGQGRAVALVLHDLPLAMAWADQVAVMEGGMLAALGTPESIYEQRVIDRVFGIGLGRRQTERGWRYYCEM